MPRPTPAAKCSRPCGAARRRGLAKSAGLAAARDCFAAEIGHPSPSFTLSAILGGVGLLACPRREASVGVAFRRIFAACPHKGNHHTRAGQWPTLQFSLPAILGVVGLLACPRREASAGVDFVEYLPPAPIGVTTTHEQANSLLYKVVRRPHQNKAGPVERMRDTRLIQL
jgi:hypothetical protein